jgi:hypothetical protein
VSLQESPNLRPTTHKHNATWSSPHNLDSFNHFASLLSTATTIMPTRTSHIPHRQSQAWLFAVPETAALPYTPIDNVDWCAQFVDDPAYLAGFSAVTLAEKAHQVKAHPTLEPPVDIHAHRSAKGVAERGNKFAVDVAVSTASRSALMNNIIDLVFKYRMQSPAHFAVRIDVGLAEEDDVVDTFPARHIKLLFTNGFGHYENKLSRLCRLELGRKGVPRPDKVCIRERNGRKMRWVPLHTSLLMNFPPNQTFVTKETMEAYWIANGKTFNWTGLPTELKENVIQFCVSDLSTYKDHFHKLPAARKLSARGFQNQDRHRSEVVQKLGDWRSLLLVSSQIRALTLRLLFNGCSTYRHGFCITSDKYYGFGRRLRRLDEHHQLTQSDSVFKPGDRIVSLLARQYRTFPKIFPRLDRYATFKHGIRKICLQFGFLDYLYFFKVTTGGIDRYRPERCVTSNVFDQMPNLNQIVVDLPKNYDRGQGRMGPILSHQVDPCPRILQRLIYEQVALELTAYRDVTVRFLLDADEEQRFICKRESAQLELKFTAEELIDLYADDEGGIPVDEDDSGTYCPRLLLNSATSSV